MPRPRFFNLEPERQRALLDAARAEFSDHGYEAASQNRIIEAAGISKGALYYYFDDKNDLFLTLLRREFLGLDEAARLGPITDAESFWSEIAAMFVRTDAFVWRDAETLALARALGRSYGRHEVAPGVVELLEQTRRVIEGWLLQGQEVGAVRSDCSVELLSWIALKLEEGMDLWFVERLEDMSPSELAALNDVRLDAFRRLLAPAADSRRPAVRE